jgi:hypothetical protein
MEIKFTRFWNNFHQVLSQRLENKIWKFLRERKPKTLERTFDTIFHWNCMSVIICVTLYDVLSLCFPSRWVPLSKPKGWLFHINLALYCLENLPDIVDVLILIPFIVTSCYPSSISYFCIQTYTLFESFV